MRFVIGLLLLGACSLFPKPTDVSQLAGVWESPAWLEYSVIEIDESGRLEWTSSGCLDQTSGRTIGKFRNGALVISEPMEEYGLGEVREFQYVRSGGREYLVADWEMEGVREQSDPFGRVHWWGLRRRLTRAEIKVRFARSVDTEERWLLLREFACWPIALDDITFLERIVCEDPDEYARDTAESALDRAGLDEDNEVQDRLVRTAADAALKRAADRNEQRTASR